MVGMGGVAIVSVGHAQFKIGDVEIPCYVLDDGRRVLVQGGMLRGLNMKQGTAGRGGGDRLAKFIATKAVNPFAPPELAEVITSPIKFRPPGGDATELLGHSSRAVTRLYLDPRLCGPPPAVELVFRPGVPPET